MCTQIAWSVADMTDFSPLPNSNPNPSMILVGVGMKIGLINSSVPIRNCQITPIMKTSKAMIRILCHVLTRVHHGPLGSTDNLGCPARPWREPLSPGPDRSSWVIASLVTSVTGLRNFSPNEPLRGARAGRIPTAPQAQRSAKGESDQLMTAIASIWKR